MDKGLGILLQVRDEVGTPVTTDIHESDQAADAAAVCDLLQIPAFLANKPTSVRRGATGRAVNVKKGQFMAPWDMGQVVEKLHGGCRNVLLSERGTFFGYGRLVNDMRPIPMMQELGVPVIYDATHSVQEPAGLGMRRGESAMVEPLRGPRPRSASMDFSWKLIPILIKSPSDGPRLFRWRISRLLERLLRIRQLWRNLLETSKISTCRGLLGPDDLRRDYRDRLPRHHANLATCAYTYDEPAHARAPDPSAGIPRAR